MNKGIRITRIMLYFGGVDSLGIRRSPDVGRGESLWKTLRHGMRKDQHTIFSDHNLVTQETCQTCRDTQQHLLCGDLDCVFVFVYLCPLQESDRIDIPRENTRRCLG